MNLKIVEIREGTTPATEYVLLDVLADTCLLGYALLDETYNYRGVSKGHPRLFRFPGWDVKKGEQIRVYTGTGKPGIKIIDNRRFHFFYWGVDECIWNNRRDKAELLFIQSIDKRSVS